MSHPIPRADERQHCQFTVEYTDVWSEDTYAGIVQDVSTHGIGLVTPRCIPQGAVVVFHFPHRAMAKVVNVLPTRYGWRVGCEFTRPMDPKDVKGSAGVERAHSRS